MLVINKRYFLAVIFSVSSLFSNAVEGADTSSSGGPDFIAPAEAVSKKSLPLEVMDPNGVERVNWPISGGIPMPRGELRNVTNIRMLNSEGKEIPVQGEILGYWPEVKREGKAPIPASIMWLGVTFLGDIKENEKSKFTLEYGTNVKTAVLPANPVKSITKKDTVNISNGLISLNIGKTEKFLQSVLVGGKEVLAGAGTSMKTDLSYTEGLLDQIPVVLVPEIKQAPVIDGKLEDTAWTKAREVKLEGFRLANMEEEKTTARIFLDEKNLYIAVDCRDKDPKGILAPKRNRDDYNMHFDDHVEIWLDAGNKMAPGNIEISVSASGAVYDRLQGYYRKWKKDSSSSAEGENSTAQKKAGSSKGASDSVPEEAAFNISGLKSAVARGPDGWTAELCIPLDQARLNWSWIKKAVWDYNSYNLTNKEKHTNTFGVQICRYRPKRADCGIQETRWPFSIYYDNQRPGKLARIPKPGSSVKDWDGLAETLTPAGSPKERAARVEVREVKIETEGPVVTIALVRGMYHHGEGYGSPFTVRLYMYAGRKDFKVFHTMTAGFPKYGERLKSVSFDLPVGAECFAGVEDGKPVNLSAGAELLQFNDTSFAVYNGTTTQLNAGHLLGSITAKTKAGMLTVFTKDFWQLFPSGYRLDKTALHIDMYSPRAMPLYFGTPGASRNSYGDFEKPDEDGPRVSRTHEMWFDFSGSEPVNYSAGAASTLLPWAGVKWNCNSLAMGHVAPYDRKTLPRLEDWMDYQLWWFVNEQREEKWYGWGNYGNTLNTLTGRGVPRGSTDGYEVGYIFEGGYGWANDRKGVALSYLMQYFRSGRRIWFDFGESAARCSTDICTSYPILKDENWNQNLSWAKGKDTKSWRKASTLRPVCQPRRHFQVPWSDAEGSAARQGGQAGWVLFYFLTGDRRARDVIEMHETFLTTAQSDWMGGGMCNSSPHGTRAQERRLLILRWIMTNDPIFQTLVEGYNRKVYAETLSSGVVAVAIRYPWFVLPEKSWMWGKQKESMPDINDEKALMRLKNIEKGVDYPYQNVSQKGIEGMHVELGGWDGPVRMHEITGDPWLAKVLVKLAGPKPEAPANMRAPVPNFVMLYDDAYQSPTIREIDMLRWTGYAGYLFTLTGYNTFSGFASGRETKSPVSPAEPEKPISRKELFTRSMKFDFNAGGVFPAGYLWPTNNYYMCYALKPLQAVAKGKSPTSK
jgi:hypothetical protein